MKSLSESVIKTLAGDGAFERGLDYYNEGRVEQLNIDTSHISGYVRGQQRYQVTLNHTAKVFEGSCDCPASDNFDFCKHCAALSLAYYYQTQTNIEVADAGDTDPVRLYLNTFTKPQLIEELQSQIQADKAIYDHWLLRAELAGGNLSVKDLRKRITQAIPYKPAGLWRPQEVANYFIEAERALNVLEQAILALTASSSIKLVIYAIERLEKTLETKGVASIATLREAYLDGGGELYACQMTVDLFGIEPDELIPEIAGWIGAASYLPKSAEADISLFV